MPDKTSPDETSSTSVKKARDRNHAINDGDRMWAPESAEDIDPVLLHPTPDAPDPPADPTPAGADFESERTGRYADVHRQTAELAKGKTPTEAGTYGQGDLPPVIRLDDKTVKEIKT